MKEQALRYPASQVPKAFKIIPNLQNWEEVLFLTDPDFWTPHAVYQATRMFVSNLNQKMVRPASRLVARAPLAAGLHPRGHAAVCVGAGDCTLAAPLQTLCEPLACAIFQQRHVTAKIHGMYAYSCAR